jgi:Uma2 family endonuclease
MMTVDEFKQLPETGPFYYELRRGELVEVARPKFKYSLIQAQLLRLLEPHLNERYWASIQIPFRPLPEYEVRSADVAAVMLARVQQADPDDFLQGAPELVIEVVSPSNTVQEMSDKERLCLENGCREFWVVDPMLLQVKVSTPDGITRTYQSGHEIPLEMFGAEPLAVARIFE